MHTIFALIAMVVVIAIVTVVLVVAALALFLWLFWPWIDRLNRPEEKAVGTVERIEEMRVDRTIAADFPTLADQNAVVVGYRVHVSFSADEKRGQASTDHPCPFHVGDRLLCRYVDGHSGTRWVWIVGPEQEAT